MPEKPHGSSIITKTLAADAPELSTKRVSPFSMGILGVLQKFA
jgi:hypothetical protein